MMAELGAREATAITLAFAEFRGDQHDEAPLAAEVAARYGARHVVRTVDRDEFEADLPAILDAMDLPTIDGINTWFVAKAAREAGVKVALSWTRRRRMFRRLSLVPRRAEQRSLVPGCVLASRSRLARSLRPVCAHRRGRTFASQGGRSAPVRRKLGWRVPSAS